MSRLLSRHALSIFRAALKAADPILAVQRHVRPEDFDVPGRIFVIGAGKASAAMAQAVERLLGKRITRGLINVKYGHLAKLRWIELNECGHPVPDGNGLRGTLEICKIARNAGPDDLVLCLISGGASALLPCPVPTVTLAEKQQLTGILLACGANIHEINCVRKHLSLVKGGQLARIAYPARVLTLVLSDVIGDSLDTIGSGPTVPDSTTLAMAGEILSKYDLWHKIPPSIANYLRKADGETPKRDDAVFERVENRIVGSNRLAMDAAAVQAQALGYRPLILSSYMQGETRDVARVHAAIAREIRASHQPVPPPCCLISGGETTVTIRGTGLGGRNQEFALAAALDLEGIPGATILSGGTDGSDGPTDAAGAISDETTLARSRALGLDATAFLNNNDSYHLFEHLGDLIKTGPTQTNVMDVRLILVSARPERPPFPPPGS